MKRQTKGVRTRKPRRSRSRVENLARLIGRLPGPIVKIIAEAWQEVLPHIPVSSWAESKEHGTTWGTAEIISSMVPMLAMLEPWKLYALNDALVAAFIGERVFADWGHEGQHGLKLVRSDGQSTPSMAATTLPSCKVRPTPKGLCHEDIDELLRIFDGRERPTVRTALMWLEVTLPGLATKGQEVRKG